MSRDYDLICLSHLRWDSVYQRPQHLLTRCARERRVFFVEEPIGDAPRPHLEVSDRQNGVRVVVPHLPEGMIAEDGARDDADAAQRELIDDFLVAQEIRRYVLWYYTPIAMGFTRHLTPLGVVYDCMDELSGFAKARPELPGREQELFRSASVVFTGGQSLYEAKRSRHPRVYAFPSGVDADHFRAARLERQDPADQEVIPRPRVGFYGVIDERMDLDLLKGIADARPDWQLVLIGPLSKIDCETLPWRSNIHYLGPRSYGELPAYLSGWDAAILPFARNASTRFISPTKTPEYLAAGRPVVSTSIRDVVKPYGERGLVRIADSVADFVAALEAALAEERETRLPHVDAFLRQMSWDRTWERMSRLIDGAVTLPNEEAAGLAMSVAQAAQ